MKFLPKALTATGLVAGVGYTVFEEVMNRKPLFRPLFEKFISQNDKKRLEQLGFDSCAEKEKWFNGQKLTEYEMINKKNYRLKAFLLPSEKESNIYVFCCHGYRSCGKAEYGKMAKFYHDMGWNVFLIDHQAAGDSDGTYIGFGYHEYQDALLWLDWMNDKFGKDIKIVLQGISMGCATVLMMNGSPALPDNVMFTVADCGYTSAKAEFEYIMKSVAHIPAFPVVPAADIFNKYINGYKFEDASPINAIRKANRPILFIHGDADDFVPTYMVHELFDAYGGPYKDLLIVNGAMHAESYRINPDAYESKVREFADKFVN